MDVLFFRSTKKPLGFNTVPSHLCVFHKILEAQCPCAFGLTEGLLLICCRPASHQVDHQPSAIAEPWTLQNE